MKTASQTKVKPKRADGLRPEYRFDYATSKPNRFAERLRPGAVAVLLDPDVARVFKTTSGKARESASGRTRNRP